MTTETNIQYFSLLFVDRDTRTHANLSDGRRDPLDVYIQCASTLAASLAKAGSSLVLLTNDEELLLERMRTLALFTHPTICSVDFSRAVPRGISFYPAHFKLDLFRYFSKVTTSNLICLLDSDAVLLKPLRISSELRDSLWVYDITGHLSCDYSAQRLGKDIELVGGKSSDRPRWYGGEFIMGYPSTFGQLANRIEQIWPNYCEHLSNVHHVGDEMVTTAALTLLQSDGIELIDAGEERIISRWWTARTNSIQIPFASAAQANVLHLPSDKPFLARKAGVAFDATQFQVDYTKYARGKLLGRRLANPFLNAFKGQRKFVATLR